MPSIVTKRPVATISIQYLELILLWDDMRSYGNVTYRFDIIISSLNRIICRLSYFLSKLSQEIIKLPPAAEKYTNEDHFRTNGFPNVVDGIHIRNNRPDNDSES